MGDDGGTAPSERAGSAAQLVVQATGLRKHYGELVAVAGVDLAIPRGVCFGFLGPNGAGKTSTLRMLQAASAPSAGSLRVLGLDPTRDGRELRSRLGVCPQEDSLDPDLTVLDNLLVYGSYFGRGGSALQARAEQLLERFALSDKRSARISELSGGMKRRLTLARALVNEPELVILDEPTTGLDPQARHLIWQTLRQLRDEGVTLILTTHYMDEAERLCDRLVIMDHGRILAEAAPVELIAQHVGAEVVELRCPAERESAELTALLAGGARTQRHGDVRTVFLRSRGALGEQLTTVARAAGIGCVLRNASLEDVFLELTGRGLGE